MSNPAFRAAWMNLTVPIGFIVCLLLRCGFLPPLLSVYQSFNVNIGQKFQKSKRRKMTPIKSWLRLVNQTRIRRGSQQSRMCRHSALCWFVAPIAGRTACLGPVPWSWLFKSLTQRLGDVLRTGGPEWNRTLDLQLSIKPLFVGKCTIFLNRPIDMLDRLLVIND